MIQRFYIMQLQGAFFVHSCALFEFNRKPLVLIQRSNTSSYSEKHIKFQEYRGLQCSFLGTASATESAPYRSDKVKVFDRGNAFPHIETLQRFPKEELSEKVVMVRFDSSILLQEDMYKVQHLPLVSRAFFTIKYIHEAGAKVILTSSWSAEHNSKLFSGENVAEYLSSVLQTKVALAKCISMHSQSKMEEFEKADVILLENLSNFKEDLANDLDFAERLSSGVDIFVNDAFSLSHRILASTVGITRFCHACVAGFHFEEHLHQLKKVAECSNQFISIIGGGNLTKKATALHFLASSSDGLIFVGMMAFQIMHALGMPVPLNLVEHGALEEAAEIIQIAKNRNITILLPKDFLCINNQFPKQMEIFPSNHILHGWAPVDLGPNSLHDIASLLLECEKIVWIGPVKFRMSGQCTGGTSKLVLLLDNLSRSGYEITVIGPATCEEVIRTSKFRLAYQMINTASVVWEFLKGRGLPGLVALDRAYPFELDWNTIYSDPTQPLAVDLGSGNGLFLMGMATMRKDINFLGLEINKKLVSRCQDSAHQSGLKNIYFIATNATSTFRTIVSTYLGALVLVSIQCPNPDFNQPEYRWRMVQRSLVQAIIDLLTSGGRVFLQSDIEAVAVRMRDQFLRDSKGTLAVVQDKDANTLDHRGWLKDNPFGVRSDWERHVVARGAPMYRLMLSKVDNC